MNTQDTLIELRDSLRELQKMTSFRLIQGDGIRITEVTGNGELLLEAVPDTRRLEALERWLLTLEGRIDEMEQEQVQAQVQAARSARQAAENARSNGTPLPLGSKESSEFPFQVLQEGANSLRVLGYNPDEGRFFHSLVYAGTRPPLEIPETVVNIHGWNSGYVLLSLSRVNADEGYSLRGYCRECSAETLPAPSENHYDIPLAYYSGGRKREDVVIIRQIQFGAVHISGRVV